MSGRVLAATACMAMGLAAPIDAETQRPGNDGGDHDRTRAPVATSADAAPAAGGPRRPAVDWRTPDDALSVVAATGLPGATLGGRPSGEAAIDLRTGAAVLYGDGEVDSGTVTMAAIAGGVAGFFVGLYVPGMLGEDPLLGLLAAPPLSVVSTGVSAHLASGRRGDAMASIALGLAATAVLAVGMPEYGGILLGPVIAIPIAVALETR